MRVLQFKRSFVKKPTALLLIYLTIFLLFVVALILYQNKDANGKNFKIIVDSSKKLQEESKSELGSMNYIVGKDEDFDKSRTNENKTCSSIHIAIVCGRFNSTRNLYVLLKSILFYRTDNINLHLFVDNISRAILEELFNSWVVPDLTVEFYNMTLYEHEVSWITSDHYSHRYGLMKLVFLSVLSEAKNLSKVILLDTDMLAFGNINDVWNADRNLNTKSGSKLVFGMVENQSDWYLGKTHQSESFHSVWPAIGRGFNSGLLLVNLEKLRLMDWRQMWRQVAELELTTHLTTSLADQDIFNAIFRSHSFMIYELPCSYNIQLNDHSNLNDSCFRSQEFMLVHWNSPYKLLTKNTRGSYFRNWYFTFLNWDGGLLHQSFCGLNEDSLNSTSNSTNGPLITDLVCRDIQPRPEEKLRTFLYFKEFELEQVEHDVTFVVHLSLDRLQTLDQLAEHWQGPISAAIYLSESETNLLLSSIQNSNNLIRRKNIGFHLVFRGEGFSYPINRLRNIALNNVLTPYVFLSDIDFLPSFNLYQYLRQIIPDMILKRDNEYGVYERNRALVVPAFENLQYKFDFPSSKAELLTQLNLGTLSMFREQLWPQGHAPTDYAKWRASTKPYKVEWKLEYEPFIVVSRDVTRFDERFVGFGWNKVEHIMQLAASGYEFYVLPEAFVIHKFHSASFDIMKHRESVKYRACIKRLRREFLHELKKKNPEFFDNLSAHPANNIGKL